jgi:hypothetical protein
MAERNVTARRTRMIAFLPLGLRANDETPFLIPRRIGDAGSHFVTQMTPNDQVVRRAALTLAKEKG